MKGCFARIGKVHILLAFIRYVDHLLPEFVQTDVPIGGFQAKLDQAAYIVAGNPLDQTATFRSGCGKAPDAIRNFAMNLETINPYSKNDIASSLIHDLGNISIADRKQSLDVTEELLKYCRKESKIPLVLGGEHTISIPAGKVYDDHVFVIFDAHLDLRDEYDGDPLSHASAIRRIFDHVNPDQLIFIGTRAVSMEEQSILDDNPAISVFPGHLWSSELKDNALNTINKRLDSYAGLYLSVDMDGFDPSWVPGVGNPEPLGLTTREFFGFINELPKINAADINELNPLFDKTGASTAVAARLAIYLLSR